MISEVRIGKYQLHHGEEPCISGTHGSGTVFFSGCNLGCVFCQNDPISRHGAGQQYTIEQLADIFRELEEQGAHNINIVTGYSWAERIIRAFDIYRPNVPVVWNSSGYEDVGTIRLLEDYVDVYLPDFKYYDESLAFKFTGKSDYPEVARRSISEMLRQKGNPEFDNDGIIRKGVIIRHLVLPLHLKNTESVINHFSEYFGDAWFSLMLQYTPVVRSDKYPELNRTLTKRECEKAVMLLYNSGIENGYVQDPCAATTELIPDFI
ncbi:MAG: radical SAM protein [Lachnospiraceae bacterium]|nr:radical SAM protein [Lachnospiraceae bacterium]